MPTQIVVIQECAPAKNTCIDNKKKNAMHSLTHTNTHTHRKRHIHTCTSKAKGIKSPTLEVVLTWGCCPGNPVVEAENSCRGSSNRAGNHCQKNQWHCINNTCTHTHTLSHSHTHIGYTEKIQGFKLVRDKCNMCSKKHKFYLCVCVCGTADQCRSMTR